MLISAYSTCPVHCPHGFVAVDERGTRDDSGTANAELVDHLAALTRHIRSGTDGALTLEAHALLRHVADTQRWYSFTLDETDRSQLSELSRWATEADAVLLVDGALLDGQGRPLLAGDHGPASGVVPTPDEAAQRAAEVRSWLASQHQVRIPVALAPVRSSAEVQLQDVEDVGLRIVALVMTSDFASSLIAGHPIDPSGMQTVFPRSFASLSPRERDLFARRDPWAAHTLLPRIEAAQELLWGVSRISFGWPNQACPVDEVKAIVLSGGEEGFLEGLALRHLPQVLDEYECLASLMWAVDEQHHLKTAAIVDTDPNIAAERLAALSWLLNRGLAWDDADRHDRSFWS